ncbi:MAG: zinc ribbon domain-containing protein [Pseudomonadales bacterium]|nr:zinc ribbon domain-containing protein [Pseudomonadales bacterium]NIX09879.1 zinc ribbon domain-containing protein [Pseudomonadales bacterium]
MPIYEYRCSKCGHELETIQKISEAPLETCPECAQDALIKKVSAAGFRLKGGGWYETDFKSGNKRNITEDKKDGADKSSSNETSESSSGSGGKPGDGAPKSSSSTPSSSSAGKSE